MRVAGVTLLVAFTCAATLPAQEPTKDDLLRAVEKKLQAVSEKAGPCVACVVVSKNDRYPKPAGAADQPGKLGAYNKAEFLKAHPTEKQLANSLDLSKPDNIADNGYGCGVVIDASGLILTPYHVVEGATKLYIHLPGVGGSYADIYAADARHDLAMLKLISPPAGLTAIKFADVRVSGPLDKKLSPPQGKLVISVANPFVPGFALNRPSAALGSITNVRWPDDSAGEGQVSYYKYGPLLEHDAKLNTEVSGAALLNLDGELIGLTTITTPGGERTPGYAFPADGNFRRVVEVLRRGEEVEYGMLGVTVDIANGLSFQVQPVGPAARSGIRGGGQITHVNGHRISTFRELLLYAGSALAGSRLKLTVIQGVESHDYDITLGKYPHKQPSIASVRPEPVFGLRVDYSTGPAGVVVRELTPNSPAAAAFKKLGDRGWLITHVNGVAVVTPPEFYSAAKGQKSITLTAVDAGDPKAREREVTLP